ncbi:uncharacterized protein CDAR_26331 [Caerostris darwini]|uniref:Immunoglobulin V-set domain-containing protein n=1 Tax=Caerostris darwini TaxID=1538125 RepID=A0AAV4PUP4_9ARAC|nr:uncharacterized protein CDAR_26331 [Caerostris darwini]
MLLRNSNTTHKTTQETTQYSETKSPVLVLSSSLLVSFVRQRDRNILTAGKFTYTTDQRFSAYHLNDTCDWTLEIRDTRKSDAGIYECQVSSDPKISLPIQLNIIGKYIFGITFRI